MQYGQFRASSCSRVVRQYWSISPSPSTLQDLSSTSPAKERNDGRASGNLSGSHQKNQKQIKKRDGNRDSDDRLRDLLDRLEEFTDNLQDTEVPAPAHISQDSDSERATKVLSKSREHSTHTHFPKDRNCEVCLRTKNTRALAEDALAKLYLEKSLVTW